MYTITIHEEDFDDVNEFVRHFDTINEAYVFSFNYYKRWKEYDWAGYEARGIPVFPTFNQFTDSFVHGIKKYVYEFGHGCVMEIWLS